MPAAIELKEIVLMKQTDKEWFEGALNEWYDKWKTFLNERTINEETGKFLHPQKIKKCLQKFKTNLPGYLPGMIILNLESQIQPMQ